MGKTTRSNTAMGDAYLVEAAEEARAREQPLRVGGLLKEAENVLDIVALQVGESPNFRQRERLLVELAITSAKFLLLLVHLLLLLLLLLNFVVEGAHAPLVVGFERAEAEAAFKGDTRGLERLHCRCDCELVELDGDGVWAREAKHLEDRGKVGPHLLQVDEAVAVVVVQREDGAYFLVTAAAAQHRQARDKLCEVGDTVTLGLEELEKALHHVRVRCLRRVVHSTAVCEARETGNEGASVQCSVRRGGGEELHDVMHVEQAQLRRRLQLRLRQRDAGGAELRGKLAGTIAAVEPVVIAALVGGVPQFELLEREAAVMV